MKYTLNELLDDKALRAELLEKPFVFVDEDGDFFAVDFENESMRRNHITVFEVLYSLGGDALFEKLIADGTTCLTKDAEAAKVGVVPVGGAEGYYLKTNASSVAAFNSILNGLSGLSQNDRFTFVTDAASTAAVRIADCNNNYETDYSYSVIEIREREDGRFVVFDLEEETTVSFSLKKGFDTVEIDSFYVVEPLFRKDESDFDENKAPIAYRYKLNDEEKWGVFSANLEQIVPPEFYDVCVTSKNLFVAGAIDIDLDDNPCYVVYFEKIFWGSRQNILDLSQGFKVEEPLLAEGRVDRISLEDNSECVCFVTGGNSETASVYYPGKRDSYGTIFGAKICTGNKVSIQSGILTGENSKRRIAVRCVLGYYFMNAGDYHKLYCDAAPGYNAWLMLDDYVYVLECDGFYAVAKLRINDKKLSGAKSNVLELGELLTPYAFTDISPVNYNCVLVDRFGKKGLFDYTKKAYVIPCEYEAIEHISDDNTFKVSKAGFSGTVKISGKGVEWLEQLHREN